MGLPSELSLDYKPNSYKMIPKPVGGEQPDETQKLEAFLSRLEVERLKIDAFKRELPLCMQLLTNAMEAYKQQLDTYHTNHGTRPVLEEFIPLKNQNTEGPEKSVCMSTSEKASWMTSAQLWSQANDEGKQQETDVVYSKLCLDSKQRNGGAFLPFSKDKNKCPSSTTVNVLPELALASADRDMDEKKCSEMETATGAVVPRRESCGKGGGGGASVGEHGRGTSNNSAEGQAVTQAHRKARRCWSPDLHRRFVSALQMLGGSQVATPKQIREMMKVDGLTNDEVKSHLQKYRLHTRRPIQTQHGGASTQPPHLVVLGGIWVSPEYATSAAAATGGPTIYGAHPAPTHYCTAPMPQDFYPPPTHNHHSLRRDTAPAIYKSGHGQPEFDVRGSEERSESIEDGEEREEEEEGEDGKSESSGWKGREEKPLVPMSEDVEDSNGTDVTLKF